MNSPRITYIPHSSDATPESELSVLANIYGSKKATESIQPRAGDAMSSIRRKEAG
jgi:hypothetical protein